LKATIAVTWVLANRTLQRTGNDLSASLGVPNDWERLYFGDFHHANLGIVTFSRLDESAMKAVDIHEGIDSTTKPVGTGTGMGLSISYQIIEKHQGKLECVSTPGQGTEFVIKIPIRQSASLS
jgi:Histidine kinase-, DNA gyrase B-, and HSP90-like ATPase